MRHCLLLLPLLLSMLLSAPSHAAPNCGEGAVDATSTDLRTALTGLEKATPSSKGSPTSLRSDAFVDQGLKQDVLSLALKAFQNAWERGEVDRRVLMVVDFSLPMTSKRLWIIDLATNELLYNEWVGHGKASGRGNRSTRFSNVSGSKKSSIGVYSTWIYRRTSAGQRHHKGSAPALEVQGLEDGWNDNANDRAILIHEAWYTYKNHGGHSEGCFTVRPQVRSGVLSSLYGTSYAHRHQASSEDANHEGEGHHSLIFAYYPDKNWLNSSSYLK